MVPLKINEMAGKQLALMYVGSFSVRKGPFPYSIIIQRAVSVEIRKNL